MGLISNAFSHFLPKQSAEAFRLTYPADELKELAALTYFGLTRIQISSQISLTNLKRYVKLDN